MLENRRKSLISKDKKYHNWIKILVPFASWIHIVKPFILSLTLNCHISETVRDFDLIPPLGAGPQHQLSFGSLVEEDYTQQNGDWAALKSFKCNLWVLILTKFFFIKPKNTSDSPVSGYQTIQKMLGHQTSHWPL